MIKVKLKNGSEVMLKNRKWISADPELAAVLNELSENFEIGSSDYYPDKDQALALKVIKNFGGKITFMTEIDYSKYPDDVCF